MRLLDLSECRRDLDFKPCGVSKENLPSVAWRGYLLTGFHRNSGVAINLDAPLHGLLHDCYPQLTLPELARFMDRLKDLRGLDDYVNINAIFTSYQLQFHPELVEIFSIILGLPIEMQNWISEKKLTPRQLYPLRSIQKQRFLELKGFVYDLFNHLRIRKTTNEQITKIVEIAVDIYLQHKNVWPKTGQSADSWLRNLDAERNPKDQELNLNSIVQTKWVRQGDSAGLEVKYIVSETEENISRPDTDPQVS